RREPRATCERLTRSRQRTLEPRAGLRVAVRARDFQQRGGFHAPLRRTAPRIQQQAGCMQEFETAKAPEHAKLRDLISVLWRPLAPWRLDLFSRTAPYSFQTGCAGLGTGRPSA